MIRFTVHLVYAVPTRSEKLGCLRCHGCGVSGGTVLEILGENPEHGGKIYIGQELEPKTGTVLSDLENRYSAATILR